MRDLRELKMTPYYRRPYPPPKANEIEAFECCFGVLLPDDYVTFLKYRNGGAPRVKLVKIGGEEWDVNDFYGLGPRVERSSNENSEWDYGNLWAETWVRREVLGKRDVPIGEDPGDSVFFLDCSRNPTPVKLLLGHSRRIVDIAPSFAEFVGMLAEV